MQVVGRPADSKPATVYVRTISTGYLRAIGLPLLAGRAFDERDQPKSPQVVLVNQRLARTAFPTEDPVGKRLKVEWHRNDVVEIVGVASDIRHSDPGTPPDPCLFMPNDQQPFPFTSLVVRTTGDPAQLERAIREQIRLVDPDQGISKIEAMQQMV